MAVAGVGAVACLVVVVINLFPPAQLAGSAQAVVYAIGMVIGVAVLCLVPIGLTRRRATAPPPAA